MVRAAPRPRRSEPTSPPRVASGGPCVVVQPLRYDGAVGYPLDRGRALRRSTGSLRIRASGTARPAHATNSHTCTEPHGDAPVARINSLRGWAPSVPPHANSTGPGRRRTDDARAGTNVRRPHSKGRGAGICRRTPNLAPSRPLRPGGSARRPGGRTDPGRQRGACGGRFHHSEGDRRAPRRHRHRGSGCHLRCAKGTKARTPLDPLTSAHPPREVNHD